MTRCILGSNGFPERARVRGIPYQKIFDCSALPIMMQPQAQERVVQVVVAGDGREHPLDGLFFFGAGARRRRGLSQFFYCQHGSVIVSPAEDARQAGPAIAATRRLSAVSRAEAD